jgi:hypothetical protein
MSEPEPTGTRTVPTYHPGRVILRIIASLWMVVALSAGMNFINATRMETYGGDAYTGIQNAVARGTTALGFLIIGTGVIAVVAAFRREN